MKTLVIIPAYNEEGSIQKVVESLADGFPQYDYIVINDGFDLQGKRISDAGSSG